MWISKCAAEINVILSVFIIIYLLANIIIKRQWRLKIILTTCAFIMVYGGVIINFIGGQYQFSNWFVTICHLLIILGKIQYKSDLSAL